jgi:hypothetical protein
MRLVPVTLVIVAAVGAAQVAAAQPEDRRQSVTGPVDPNVTDTRDRGPSSTWPGFDSRVPMPRGATSHTGVAPPGRDPSSNWLPGPSVPGDVPYRGAPQPPQPPAPSR